MAGGMDDSTGVLGISALRNRTTVLFNQPADGVALVLELPLGGIRCWESAVLLLVASKAHPKVTVKTTGRLVRALASYADWTTGADIRPGWKRLIADVGCSRRSIAYHLGFLREMGVLVRVYHGTHLPGGSAMASVYAARIPNTTLARAAKEQAVTARRKAERTRSAPTIGARYVTCPASEVRSSRARAAAKPTVARTVKKRGISADPFKNCTPPRAVLDSKNLLTHLGSPASTAKTDKSSATKGGARDLAQWLVSEVAQFRGLPVGLVANLLTPLAAAGWTRDDLAYWLGLRPLPAWYIAHTTGHRTLDPWPLPAPGRVQRPYGLLAHRCGGLAWRGFEPTAAVRSRAHAASVARTAELPTDAERQRQAEADAAAERERLAAELRERLDQRVPVPAPRSGVIPRPAFVPEPVATPAQPGPAWLAQVHAAATEPAPAPPSKPARPRASTPTELLALRLDRWRAEGRLTDDNAAADR